ncbi:MAG: hypothetical protein DSY70_02390 [Desulfobulbus sp.]|nr:MAG: hypothetical protein DSY70_02390 [Desulfobulbus sp.]
MRFYLRYFFTRPILPLVLTILLIFEILLPGQAMAVKEEKESIAPVYLLLLSKDCSLRVSSESVIEGDVGGKTMMFTLSMNHCDKISSVSYMTQDGTATVADNDYMEVSGTISFPSGPARATVAVTIKGDAKVESLETLSLILVAPDNLTLENNGAVGAIINDDITPSVSVNDTGVIWGGNFPKGNNSTCSGVNIDAQDCSHGRDVTFNDDTDGRAGFSFTKISAGGDPLPASAPSWACVKDNVTGLIWEVKTDNGNLHDKDDRYSWYNTDPGSNGGVSGILNNDGNICLGYNSGDSSTFCNTEAYTARVNDAGLCGASDWRMPTIGELEGLLYYGETGTKIDTDFFPNATRDSVWSGSAYADFSMASWYLSFASGTSGYANRDSIYPVRLVRQSP